MQETAKSRADTPIQARQPEEWLAVTGGIETITEFFGLNSSLLCYRSAGIL